MSAKPHTTIDTLRTCKRDGGKFAVLTCYDYSTARLMEEAGMSAILVGDTYGEVCLGHSTTLPVTMDQMIAVTRAVRVGAPSTYLIGDMPYLSYQVSPEEAIRNAGRFMAEAGCDCVKVEVDGRLAETVSALSRATIPVMAHLGLRPQSIHQHGGYRIQGKTAGAALELIEDARRMEASGAIGLLLECVPLEVAQIITESTELPVIGCVAGPYCDGTVVVMHDMLGYGGGHPPRSVKQYAHLHDVLTLAFREYVSDVRGGRFPTLENALSMPPAELSRLRDLVDAGVDRVSTVRRLPVG